MRLDYASEFNRVWLTIAPEQRAAIEAEVNRRLDELIASPDANWGSITNTSAVRSFRLGTPRPAHLMSDLLQFLGGFVQVDVDTSRHSAVVMLGSNGPSKPRYSISVVGFLVGGALLVTICTTRQSSTFRCVLLSRFGQPKGLIDSHHGTRLSVHPHSYQKPAANNSVRHLCENHTRKLPPWFVCAAIASRNRAARPRRYTAYIRRGWRRSHQRWGSKAVRVMFENPTSGIKRVQSSLGPTGRSCQRLRPAIRTAHRRGLR
jgi:hypothetical protein